MSSTSPSLTILSEEQKFNGDNLLSWTTNMTQLLGAKGLLGYIDGKITLPTRSSSGTSTTHPTPIYSTTPTADEWHFRDQLTRGHITLNCTDVAGLGVKTTGTAKEAWDSIRTEWGTSTDMRRSHAQELLNKTTYAEGASVQDHVKLLRTRKAAVDNLSIAAMNDETWRGIIIRSIPPTPRWLPVIPSLYTLTSPADIISNLLAHGMILDRGYENPSDVALAARGAEECTNPNCKARIRSTHKTEDCYWPGGGKEGQFPPNFGQRSKANSATLNSCETTQHFALSAWIPKQRGTSNTVSVILIDDPDERSHHMLPNAGDNTPLFDTLFDTLDNAHTMNDSGNTAVLDIGDPSTPDFTLTSVKTRTETSTTVFDINLATDGSLNVPVEGEGENLAERADKEGNQPIPLDKPKLDIDRLSTPHGEEDPTEVEINEPDDGPTISNSIQLPMAQPEEQGEYRGKVTSGESGDEDEVDWGIATMDERPKGVDEKGENVEETTRENPKEQRKANSMGEGRHKVYPGTTDDAKSIQHLHTDQITAKLVLQLMDPGFPNFKCVHLNSTISDERIGGEESEDVDDDDNEADWATSTTTTINETKERRGVNTRERDDAKSNPRDGDDAKSNPREEDDAKSIPLPPINDHLDFDGAEPISMQMDLNATLLKNQHLCSLAEITNVEDLPYREGIKLPIYTPMDTNSKIPPTIPIIDEILDEPPQISSDQSRGGGGTSWINPRKNQEGPTTIATQFSDNPRIVNTDAAFTTTIDVITAETFAKILKGLGGMHSKATKHVFRTDETTNPGIKHPYDDPIPVRSNFNGVEAVSDHVAPLPKVQYPPTVANIKKTKDLPDHEACGVNMHAPTDTSPDVAFATSAATRFLDMDALHSEAIKRVFQPTKGIGDVGLACEDEENELQHLPDAGGASLHSRKVGHMDGRNCFLGQPKEARAPDALSMTEKWRMAAPMWLRHPFWEIFSPPPEVNKPPCHARRASYITEHGGGPDHPAGEIAGDISTGNNHDDDHALPTLNLIMPLPEFFNTCSAITPPPPVLTTIHHLSRSI